MSVLCPGTWLILLCCSVGIWEVFHCACVYTYMLIVRFNVLFSESSVRQAVYRTWGKVVCIQIHSPSNKHGEAEGCTVHKSGDLALLCQ